MTNYNTMKSRRRRNVYIIIYTENIYHNCLLHGMRLQIGADTDMI